MFSCGCCFHPRKDRGFLSLLLAFLMSAMLSACGGGGGTSGGFENRTYPIGGSISGLDAGEQVVLLLNGKDPLTVAADGSFTFPSRVVHNGSFNVTVGTQPRGRVCSVADNSGSGVSVTTAVNNVRVVCSIVTFTIGGNVSGLAIGQSVKLRNNVAEFLTVQGGGSFVFETPIAFDGSYKVTVATQPTGQMCSVTNNKGVNVTTNVFNVIVSCSDARAHQLVSAATDNPAPTGVAVDTQGNVYVAQWRDDSDGDLNVIAIALGSRVWSTVSKINTSNQQTTFVPGLIDPVGLTFDASGNLYIVQTQSKLIKKVESTGDVSTFADLEQLAPEITAPSGIYFDSLTNKFYVTDEYGYIAVIAPDGTTRSRLITILGAKLSGVVVDANGIIYVCDSANDKILSVSTSSNEAKTFAGSTRGFADGDAGTAKFQKPMDITKAANGSFYVVDQENNKIRIITAEGDVTTLEPTLGSSASGGVTFNSPRGIAVDANGVLYVTEYYGRSVYKIDIAQP